MAAFEKAAASSSTAADDQTANESIKREASQSPVKEKLDLAKKLRSSMQNASGQDDANSAVLGAISELSAKMDRMALKSDLDQYTTEMKQHTKVAIAEAVDPVKESISQLTKRVQTLEGLPSDPSRSLAAMEAQLAALTDSMRKGFVAIIGNLSTTSSEKEAKQWVLDKITAVSAPTPVDIFCKGDFRGLLYAKFDSSIVRDKFIEKMKGTTLKQGSSRIWVDEARSLDDQSLRGFLFGLKKLMVTWDYEKRDLWVDTDTCALSFGTDTVATAQITDNGKGIEVVWGNGFEILRSGDW